MVLYSLSTPRAYGKLFDMGLREISRRMMLSARGALLVSLILSTTSFSAMGAMCCSVDTKNFCSPEGSEAQQPMGDFVIIDIESGTYSLCQEGVSACQVIAIRGDKRSGIFSSVSFGGQCIREVE